MLTSAWHHQVGSVCWRLQWALLTSVLTGSTLIADQSTVVGGVHVSVGPACQSHRRSWQVGFTCQIGLKKKKKEKGYCALGFNGPKGRLGWPAISATWAEIGPNRSGPTLLLSPLSSLTDDYWRSITTNSIASTWLENHEGCISYTHHYPNKYINPLYL